MHPEGESVEFLLLGIRSIVLGLIIAFLLGCIATRAFLRPASELCDLREYPLINPLLWCQDDLPSAQVFVGEYEAFEDELGEWIDVQKKIGAIEDAAVYFRDMQAGPWFGINERAGFVPASLFKLPTLIAILRVAKSDPHFLQEQLSYSGSLASLRNVEYPSESVEVGRFYSVEELLEKMIVYSDNISAEMLYSLLAEVDKPSQSISFIYGELGMLNARDKFELSVKSYSSLFRILYNARYLGPELSQKALQLLSKSEFKKALPAGVSEEVRVAHKFGIRDIPGDSHKQFHDCGIVYHPSRPYILCIMTKSSDNMRAVHFIRDVSKKVYEHVSDRLMPMHKIL